MTKKDGSNPLHGHKTTAEPEGNYGRSDLVGIGNCSLFSMHSEKDAAVIAFSAWNTLGSVEVHLPRFGVFHMIFTSIYQCFSFYALWVGIAMLVLQSNLLVSPASSCVCLRVLCEKITTRLSRREIMDDGIWSELVTAVSYRCTVKEMLQ